MNSTIKTILKFLPAFILLVGATFFLQGINVLPGSFMTGDPQWAINGTIIMIVGAGLFWFANRR